MYKYSFIVYNKYITLDEVINMAKSKSRKLREKAAKVKGYDLHAALRGGQFIAIDTTTKRTKTKKEKLQQRMKKDKQSRYHSDGERSAFYFCLFSI
jgi:hypothetical protein